MGFLMLHPIPDPRLEVIVDLLPRIPKVWTPVVIDELTADEDTTLNTLVAAALVERRSRVRLRLIHDTRYIEATYAYTGLYGLAEAAKPVIGTAWHHWRDAVDAWKASEAGEVSPLRCESIGVNSWRLTSPGVIAAQDVAKGDTQDLIEFVLRRGRYADQPFPAGFGRLIQMEQHDVLAEQPIRVLIDNWSDGAQSFGTVVGEVLASHVAKQPAEPAKTSRKDGRHVETEKRLLRYLRDRKERFCELVERVLEGDSRAMRQFQELFGPTAIARHLANEGGVTNDDEVNRIRAAIQVTDTYLSEIKPVLSGQAPAGWRDEDEETRAESLLDQIRNDAWSA